MSEEELKQKIIESEEYKRANDAFNFIKNMISSVLMRRDDHIKVDESLYVLDKVLSVAVEISVKSKIEKSTQE